MEQLFGAIRISDLARGGTERDALVGRVTFDRELTPYTHMTPKRRKEWLPDRLRRGSSGL